jgi:NAD/NADP transhydrogenase beta subunit
LVYIFFLLQAFDSYAGLDSDLFYMDRTMMVFGDAKKVVEDMVKAVE